jgi:hypothetical protein
MLGALALISHPWELIKSSYMLNVDVTRYGFTWGTIDCLLAGRPDISPAYARILVTLVTPVMVAACFRLLWLALGAARAKRGGGESSDESSDGDSSSGRSLSEAWASAKECHSTYYWLSDWEVLLYYYGACISSILSLYSCQGVDVVGSGTSYRAMLGATSWMGYWEADMDQQCFVGSHLLMALLLGLPALLWYGLYLPGSAMGYLYRHRGLRNQLTFRKMNGVMYTSFRRRCFLWSAVIFGRQLLLNSGPQVLVYFGSSIQLVTFAGVLTAFILAQLAYLPFTDLVANLLELVTMCTVLFTAYAALVIDTYHYMHGFVSAELTRAISAIIIVGNSLVMLATGRFLLFGALDYLRDLDVRELVAHKAQLVAAVLGRWRLRSSRMPAQRQGKQLQQHMLERGQS